MSKRINELTPEQYKKMRFERVKDEEILVMFGYSRASTIVLWEWKERNNIPKGKDLTHFLDAEEVLQYLKFHSMKETAEHFNVNLGALYRWEKRQRRK